jgi:Kef-type K+ transport system membrane component KefB
VESATAVLADIFIMFLAAKVAGELFERIRQPAVIGELLVGVVLGPYALGWMGVPTGDMIEAFHGEPMATEAMHAIFEVLADLGVIVLLFLVGLETRLSDILTVGIRAGLVAVAGVVVPFLLGYAFVAIVLAVVSALGQGGTVSLGQIGLIAIQAVAFTIFVALAGRHAARRWSIHLERLRIRNAPFVVGVLVMLGLATAAAQIGLAAIIGAFLAGMVFAELSDQYELEHKALPLYEFLVPLFFVITGSRVDWRLFLDGPLLGIALAVTALAIVGKVIGCGAASLGLGWRRVAIVGVGMAPRGEVGLIVANVGASLAAIPGKMYSTVVIMSVLTTLVVPPILTALYGGQPAPEGPVTDYAVADGRLPEL